MLHCFVSLFSLTSYKNWKSSKQHASVYSIVFGSLKSLVFSVQTKPNKTLHLKSRSEQKKETFQR